ncbi:MAG: alpha/beta fold hydrolase, partial [Ilumatobacteraceae bacterium]|nr:alpha/beta fold hydrolase [Ilumatobacteraceae bacterium]
MARMRLCALVMVLIVTACSSEPRNSSPDISDTSVPTVSDWDTTLTWKECGSGIDCASLEVPFDYSKPDLGSFILPVARHRATQPASRIGTLLVNPGGPGSAATDWASYAVQVLSSSIVERFDIVAWDPRGVGGSDPAIDCVDTMDDYFGLDPS